MSTPSRLATLADLPLLGGGDRPIPKCNCPDHKVEGSGSRRFKLDFAEVRIGHTSVSVDGRASASRTACKTC